MLELAIVGGVFLFLILVLIICVVTDHSTPYCPYPPTYVDGWNQYERGYLDGLRVNSFDYRLGLYSSDYPYRGCSREAQDRHDMKKTLHTIQKDLADIRQKQNEPPYTIGKTI